MNDEQTPPATEPAPLNPVSHLLIQLSRIFAAVPQTSEDERNAYIIALVEMARFVREAARSTQDAGLWNAQSRLIRLAYALRGPRRRASSAGAPTDEAQGNLAR